MAFYLNVYTALAFLVVIPESGVPGERFCSLGWKGNLR